MCVYYHEIWIFFNIRRDTSSDIFRPLRTYLLPYFVQSPTSGKLEKIREYGRFYGRFCLWTTFMFTVGWTHLYLIGYVGNKTLYWKLNALLNPYIHVHIYYIHVLMHYLDECITVSSIYILIIKKNWYLTHHSPIVYTININFVNLSKCNKFNYVYFVGW